MIAIENGVSEVSAGAREWSFITGGLFGQFSDAKCRRLATIEKMKKIHHILFHRGFVQRYSDGMCIDWPEVDAMGFGRLYELCRSLFAKLNPDGVEKGIRTNPVTQLFQAFC